jgi:hypothetical protein
MVIHNYDYKPPARLQDHSWLLSYLGRDTGRVGTDDALHLLFVVVFIMISGNSFFSFSFFFFERLKISTTRPMMLVGCMVIHNYDYKPPARLQDHSWLLSYLGRDTGRGPCSIHG